MRRLRALKEAADAWTKLYQEEFDAFSTRILAHRASLSLCPKRGQGR